MGYFCMAHVFRAVHAFVAQKVFVVFIFSERHVEEVVKLIRLLLQCLPLAAYRFVRGCCAMCLRF